MVREEPIQTVLLETVQLVAVLHLTLSRLRGVQVVFLDSLVMVQEETQDREALLEESQVERQVTQVREVRERVRTVKTEQVVAR